ncbi:2390_t:CDS:2 [Acaulospora morrowiae]|uniref:2390_t:CDS:1 n=1 Tax=Acaulospora morrowiae TaxID=94023 RepID=A0A9N8YRZ9_9GLOM|nr:2390_t:CDS:2 [Acaulospora morrowiae]
MAGVVITFNVYICRHDLSFPATSIRFNLPLTTSHSTAGGFWNFKFLRRLCPLQRINSTMKFLLRLICPCTLKIERSAHVQYYASFKFTALPQSATLIPAKPYLIPKKGKQIVETKPTNLKWKYIIKLIRINKYRETNHNMIIQFPYYVPVFPDVQTGKLNPRHPNPHIYTSQGLANGSIRGLDITDISRFCTQPGKDAIFLESSFQDYGETRQTKKF